MKQIGVVQHWPLAVALQLVLAVTLHQSFATVVPTTSAPPHKDPGRPEMGRYNVTNSSGSVCLMANMGLQLNITLFSLGTNKTVQEILNLQPNHTHSSGSCHAERASLQLIMDVDQTNLTFLFTLNSTSKKYNLGEVFLSVVLPDIAEPFLAHSANLSYLRGTLGFSYMCREKQSLQITPNLTINTFQLQVQPFGLTESQFGAAEECLLDEDDMLIPIIVGAALAALVLIVLLAYLIGRKRSHAGYQTI